MQEFLNKLLEIEQNNKGEGESEDVNIFNILFRGYEEVELHSRFISYMLSSNREFLKLFVRDILKIDKKDFELTNCEVYPNEMDKTEKWEIDILIINKQRRQAIVIENKLNAIDSIHENGYPCEENNCNSYIGQLERYYHTITTGLYKNGNRYLDIEDKSFICDKDKTYVYYLTLHKDPSLATIGKLVERGLFDPSKHKINYYQIQDWLRWCIVKNKKPFFNTIIKQYLNLIKRITSDNKKALAVTDLIAQKDYWQSAFNNIERFEDVYKDVKWHTIDRFFIELKQKLGNTEITIPDEKNIAEIAHSDKLKKELKIVFNRNSVILQIVNDDKGFTLGNLSNGTWDYFSDEIKNIKFHNFSEKETFHIINKDYREWIIDKMIHEVDEKYEKLSRSFC